MKPGSRFRIREGDRAPWWLGRAWWDPYSNTTVALPLGINWVAAGGRRIWLSVRRGMRDGPFDKIQSELSAARGDAVYLRSLYHISEQRLCEALACVAELEAELRRVRILTHLVSGALEREESHEAQA